MKQQITASTTVTISGDQVSCDLGGESAILNMANGVYYGLNAVGARVWELIQEPKQVSEVRDVITAEYEVEPSQCEQDIVNLLSQMDEQGLIQVRNAQAA